MSDPLDDPRLTVAGDRWATGGPFEERVERETREIMAQVKKCDPEQADEGELCMCGKVIRARLQKAYDQPAPPFGEMEPDEEAG